MMKVSKGMSAVGKFFYWWLVHKTELEIIDGIWGLK
jgi:hypothetical protein